MCASKQNHMNPQLSADRPKCAPSNLKKPAHNTLQRHTTSTQGNCGIGCVRQATAPGSRHMRASKAIEANPSFWQAAACAQRKAICTAWKNLRATGDALLGPLLSWPPVPGHPSHLFTRCNCRQTPGAAQRLRRCARSGASIKYIPALRWGTGPKFPMSRMRAGRPPPQQP